MVNIYDKHGTKQHTEHNITSLTEATDVANYLVQGTKESYVIMRILKNSMDSD